MDYRLKRLHVLSLQCVRYQARPLLECKNLRYNEVTYHNARNLEAQGACGYSTKSDLRAPHYALRRAWIGGPRASTFSGNRRPWGHTLVALDAQCPTDREPDIAEAPQPRTRAETTAPSEYLHRASGTLRKKPQSPRPSMSEQLFRAFVPHQNRFRWH